MADNERKIKKGNLGSPGFHNVLVYAPFNKIGGENPEPRLLDNTEREFEVTAAFENGFKWTGVIEGDIDIEKSECLIILPKDVEASKVQSPFGEINLLKNSRNQIAAAKMSLLAKNAFAAKAIFLEALSGYLDFASFWLNIPLMIAKVKAFDKKNVVIHISYVTPYGYRTPPEHSVIIHKEMLPIYALYREAKNNNSAFYRFLCYYKILEGIFCRLRPTARKQAKEQGISIDLPKEVIPKVEDLENFGREIFTGRSIKDVYDNVLTPEYRNAAAHFSLQDGSILNVSEYYTQGKFENILLLSEVCCRVAINTQNKLFSLIDKKVRTNKTR